mgnify:CR=1 FL=1
MDLTKNVNEIITDMAAVIDNLKTALDGKLGKNEIATTTTLGIVKGGGNVAIADDGTLSIIKSNSLQRNKTYSVGDIAYSPNLPSWAYLECTTAGTTGATEPDFSTLVTKKTITILNKFTVSDGTVTWRLRDTRCKYEVGDIIPKVGSIKDYEYLILADGGAFDEAYTELAKVFTDGKVPNLQDGRFLEGGITAKQVKGAGLPNIRGGLVAHGAVSLNAPSGAFYTEGTIAGEPTNNNTNPSAVFFRFDASRSNSIYGSSDTVQPKSYTVKYYICYGG